MKGRERMLDETVAKKDAEIGKLKVKCAELEILVRTIRDAINIQLEVKDDEPKQQKA
jgi:hypothetical protein